MADTGTAGIVVGVVLTTLSPGNAAEPVAPAIPVVQAQAGSGALQSGLDALRRGDFNAAVRAFEAAVAAAPANAEPLFYLGQARLGAGDPGGAARDLLAARELLDGPHPGLSASLGVALMRLGRLEEARVELETALRADPRAAQPRLNLGWILLQEDRGERALELFEAVAADHPDNAVSFYYQGLVHQSNGRFERAEVAYRAAAELQPALSQARLGLAAVRASMGDEDSARRIYGSLVEQQPRLAEAHFQLGRLALRAGDLEAAIGRLERALALDPEHRGAQYNLGLAYARSGRREAGPALSTFAALSAGFHSQRREALRNQAETRAELEYRRGVEALEAGDVVSAASSFQAAIAASPEPTAEMFLGLGAAELGGDDAAAARTALEQARSLDPELADAFRLLADALDRLGMSDEASEVRVEYERLLATRRSREVRQQQ